MRTVASQLTNPFPGLRPFRSDEHHLFFGREEQTGALLATAANEPIPGGRRHLGQRQVVAGASRHDRRALRRHNDPGRLDLGGDDSPARRQPHREPRAGVRRGRSLRSGRPQHPASLTRHAQPQPLRPGRSDETVRALRTGHQPAGRGRSVRGVIPLPATGHRFGGNGRRVREPAPDRQRAGGMPDLRHHHDAFRLPGRLFRDSRPGRSRERWRVPDSPAAPRSEAGRDREADRRRRARGSRRCSCSGC